MSIIIVKNDLFFKQVNYNRLGIIHDRHFKILVPYYRKYLFSVFIKTELLLIFNYCIFLSLISLE